jgi:copper homeostasis protein
VEATGVIIGRDFESFEYGSSCRGEAGRRETTLSREDCWADFQMKDFLLELCVETMEAARAAEAGGADQIELCAELSIGGLTPSMALLTATVKSVSIPVSVLIRLRGGDFTSTAGEFEQMLAQIVQAKQAGAAGVVVGILSSDGRVDVERTRALVELAYPMKAVFHRAFDMTSDLSEALEAVVETGADCLLTSGGASDVLGGADAIARLHKQARGRLDVMAGGGFALGNLVEVVRRAGVSMFHGSFVRWEVTDGGAKRRAPFSRAALEADVRQAVQLIQRERQRRKTLAMSMR